MKPYKLNQHRPLPEFKAVTFRQWVLRRGVSRSADHLGVTENTIYIWLRNGIPAAAYADVRRLAGQDFPFDRKAGSRENRVAHCVAAYGVPRLAAELGVSIAAVYAWARKGRIPRRHLQAAEDKFAADGIQYWPTGNPA